PSVLLLCSIVSILLPWPTMFSTLSLHDALPISGHLHSGRIGLSAVCAAMYGRAMVPICATASPSSLLFNVKLCSIILPAPGIARSEEHTSELQSRFDLVCRLLLEKNKHLISNCT